MALERMAKKWTMPIADSKEAPNRFAIELGARMPKLDSSMKRRCYNHLPRDDEQGTSAFALPTALISCAAEGAAGRGVGRRWIQQCGRLVGGVIGGGQRSVEAFQRGEIVLDGGGS